VLEEIDAMLARRQHAFLEDASTTQHAGKLPLFEEVA
jgi:hypothetical protein